MVADVDSAAPEQIYPATSSQLHAVSENNLNASGWPKPTGSSILSSPAAADIDGDGFIEIVAVTRRGQVFLWRSQGTSEQLIWGTSRHDQQATGNIESPIQNSNNQGSGCAAATQLPKETPPIILLPLLIGLILLTQGYFGSSSPKKSQ